MRFEPQEPGSLMLALKLAAVRLALLAENVTRALWPIIALLLFAGALVLFDLLPLLPGWLHLLVLLALAGALLFLGWRRRKLLFLPKAEAAARRLEADSGLPHRPLSALGDQVAAGDATARALFQIHQRRQKLALAKLRPHAPHPLVARLDRFGFLAGAALLFLAAFVYGGDGWRARLSAALSPNLAGPEAQAAAVSLDAWINPPPYTGAAPIYLQSLNDPSAVLKVPTGSILLAQVQGGEGAPSLLIDGQATPMGEAASGIWKSEVDLFEGSKLAITRGSEMLGEWRLEIVPDLPPVVAFDGEPAQTERQALELAFLARDDYGLSDVKAVMVRSDQPDLPPIEIDLLGNTEGDIEIKGRKITDLTPHLWAGLAVDVTLVATDALGQEGVSEPLRIVLPERVFYNLVARQLIELRRRLTLDPEERSSIAQALAAIYAQPQEWNYDTVVALALQSAERRLIYGRDDDTVPSVQQLLWDTALRLDGKKTELMAQELRRLQEELLQALENNASDEEIEQLTKQLKEAMDQYLQELAEAMKQKMQEGMDPMPMPDDAEIVTQQDLESMIDRMNEAAKSGNKEEAQRLLEELQQMLENLQENPFAMMPNPENEQAREQMRNMEDMMRRQQELLDRSQQQADKDPSQRSPEESQQSAEDQEHLRKDLGKAMRDLAEQLGDLPPEMGNAERAMREAEQSLEQGDPQNAIGPQTEALDQLQQTFQDMAEQMLQQMGPNRGEGQGRVGSRPGQGVDPLGRNSAQGGSESLDNVGIPAESEMQRSREILDELRQRRSDPSRPAIELDYLDRLLEQF